ncbi:MAG: cobalt transporter CbiM [Gemmatimonadota bacterium]
MHISEGVLSPAVLAAGAALTAGGVALGIRRMGGEEVPKVAVLSSAFFVASLIHVPVGPSNVHLVLNGITGLILGWAAFPAILVGTTLHALLFQFGGLTSLGVNTFNMAFPAVVCRCAFGPLVRRGTRRSLLVAGFAAGALAVALSGLLIAASLVLTGESFLEVAGLALAAHVPVMLAEGLLTASCVTFLGRVKPALLGLAGRPAGAPAGDGGQR